MGFYNKLQKLFVANPFIIGTGGSIVETPLDVLSLGGATDAHVAVGAGAQNNVLPALAATLQYRIHGFGSSGQNAAGNVFLVDSATGDTIMAAVSLTNPYVYVGGKLFAGGAIAVFNASGAAVIANVSYDVVNLTQIG